MKRLLVITLVFLPAGLLQKSEMAIACSSSPHVISLDSSLAAADVMVKATIVETDDRGKNAILQVEKYLMGSGPDFLLLYRQNPVFTATYFRYHYDTGCAYDGLPSFNVNTTAYFALTRNNDGSYSFQEYGRYSYQPTHTYYETQYYPLPETMPYQVPLLIDVAGVDEPANWRWVEVASNEDFETVVEFVAGESATLPLIDEFYGTMRPILTPLLITTDKGTQYMLPVDNGSLVKLDDSLPINQWSPVAYPDVLQTPLFCNEVDCVQLTSDRSLEAWQVAENFILVDYYPYSPRVPFSPSDAQYYDNLLEGQAFAFSPTGETLAVINNNLLTLYQVSTIRCEDCGTGEYSYEITPMMVQVAVISLDWQYEESALIGVRWSADGNVIAYSDAQGIWTWDLFWEEQPELGLRAGQGEFLTLLFLSNTGRFLAYTLDRASNRWLTLNRMTGDTFENTIVSPTERYMIQIAPESITPQPGVVHCGLPSGEYCIPYFSQIPRRFEWIDGDRYYVISCENEASCRFLGEIADYREDQQTYEQRIFPGGVGDIRDVAFEPSQELFVVAKGTTLYLQYRSGDHTLYEQYEFRFYDLQEQLDGEIMDVEWLPSLFYNE